MNRTYETLAVHPLITALEKAEEPAVVVRGFLGTSDDSVIRVYSTLGMSSYIEIPKDKTIYVEAMPNGEPGEVRAFVPASIELLEVRKRRALPSVIDWASARPDANPNFPPLRPKPTFWTCAAGCEGVFASAATRILVDEGQALQAPPEQQQVLLAQIEQRKHEAKVALLACLTSCISQYGAPPFMAVPDDSPTGFHVERFSAGTYHGIIVAKYLERPE